MESTNETAQAPLATEVEVESSSSVATNLDLSGHDAAPTSSSSPSGAVPRLDGLFVRSAFQRLKAADEEIQTGIEEAVARQLEAEVQAAADPTEETPEVIDPLVAEALAAGESDAVMRQSSDIKVQEAVQAEADQVVTSEVIEAGTTASEADAAPLTEKVVTSETTEKLSFTASSEEIAAPKTTASEPSSPQAAAPGNATPQPAPGLAGMFGNASPDEIAALMAYLQQLQAQKTGGSNEAVAPQTAAPKASPQDSPQPVTPEPSIPESHSAEAVASMTEPIEPSGQESNAQQSASAISPEPEIPEPVFLESNVPETAKSDSQSSYEAMLDAVAPEAEAVDPPTGVEDAQVTLPEDLPAENAANASFGTSVDDIYGFDSASQEEPKDNKTDDLESVLDKELSDKAFEALASTPVPQAKEVEEREPSRLPRNVQAYYLQPLRRVAEYGVPSCDLQLRSYSLRPLESFCDFALRAAYYLGLPAYGPTPLPKIIERWTVPRSTFIHKKSQENFERITRRRLIQIKDGHPETVQIWLAFLQKHQQAAVGMKANLWEFSGLSKLLYDLFLQHFTSDTY